MLVLGILFFSLGEMATGPKKSEYLALIAPPGKKGLYLGYVNIPVGVGVYVGSKIAGYVYGHYGEKAVLALRYLAENTPFGVGKGWNGDVTTLETVLGVQPHRGDAEAPGGHRPGSRGGHATALGHLPSAPVRLDPVCRDRRGRRRRAVDLRPPGAEVERHERVTRTATCFGPFFAKSGSGATRQRFADGNSPYSPPCLTFGRESCQIGSRTLRESGVVVAARESVCRRYFSCGFSVSCRGLGWIAGAQVRSWSLLGRFLP